MKFDYCILGGTGAVGKALYEYFKQHGSCLVLNRANADLSSLTFSPPGFSTNIFINAAGTFSGLKQYEAGDKLSSDTFVSNLGKLVTSACPSSVINISSACLSNYDNYLSSSPYFGYAQIKSLVESCLAGIGCETLINMRLTNIISNHENYLSSGHSIASIFRKFQASDSKINIWSSPIDWREYLDADDVAPVIQALLSEKISGTFSFGSGQKTTMETICNLFNSHFDHSKEIMYDQPYKPGPVDRLIGIPPIHMLQHINVTPIDVSIAKCYSAWSC